MLPDGFPTEENKGEALLSSDFQPICLVLLSVQWFAQIG
jgi:hypothetical protein